MLRSWFARIWRTSKNNRRRNLTVDRTTAVESLETRILLSATVADQDIIVQPDNEVTTDATSPKATAGPTGLSPDQIRQAYGFNSITFADGSIVGDGTGTTIAIVDAYDDPNIASDLHQFDLQYGLSDPVFTKVNQTGGTSLPKADTGWASEIALDVEWAHAIAPGASILLVEAKSSSLSDLMTAVDYARHASGVVAVSMSWGSSEFAGETSYDSYFTTPAGHTGVTFFVSSGDDGAPAEYPASSPNVVSVGGTTLNISSNGTYQSETGWSGSGGGTSKYESQPSYQKGVVTQSTTARTSPDVSYDADPNTGFSVYDSYGNSAAKPWSQYGGTSAAAPQWAGLVAIADQGRAIESLGSLDGVTQSLPKLYTLPATDFHDVTSGSSTGSPKYTAQAGYDQVTGRGSPIANLVVDGLVGTTSTTTTPPVSTTPVATHFVITATATSTAGTSFSITVKALDASNNVVTGYSGTVHLTTSDGAGIIPGNYTFTTIDNGVHTFSSVTLKTAGSQNIKVADTASSSLTGTANILVTPAAANHLVFSQGPTGTTLNATISPAVTVQIVDAYTSELQSVSGTSTAIKSGGIAFRTYGGTADWDTVQVATGVNNLVNQQSVEPLNLHNSSKSQSATNSFGATVEGIDSTAANDLVADSGSSLISSTTDGDATGDEGRTRNLGHRARHLTHHALTQAVSSSDLDQVFRDLF
ncbi:MAG: pcp 2 [Planctomycetaceae bacterium]|nr:pcp 2 [Planctomycetaceae bacterium]